MDLDVDPRVRMRRRQPPVLERLDHRRFDAILVADLTDPPLRPLKCLVAKGKLSRPQPFPQHSEATKARPRPWWPTLSPRPGALVGDEVTPLNLNAPTVMCQGALTLSDACSY